MDIVSRAAWRARPPQGRIQIPMPTPRLWIHHTAGNERGAAGMRSIQNYHMDGRGWRDIAYSFVIDNDDGVIYEGRGAGVAGGHTEGDNSKSHAICVMGNFEIEPPTSVAITSIIALARHGKSKGWWIPTCGGHRDAPGANTACPGRRLYGHLPSIQRSVSSGIVLPKEHDMTLAELIEAMNEDTPLSNRIQKQADQGAGKAIERQATVEGSALRTMVRNIVREEITAANEA
jgi:hypothetical protein